MAIDVLIRAVDSSVTIPVHARWRVGDIVSVHQSPWVWGALETLPIFWRVTIEGIDFTDPRVQQFLEFGADEPDGEITRPRFRRARFLNTPALPAPLRNALASGTVTVRANQIAQFDGALTVRT